MSELYCSDMMRFLGSYIAKFLHPYSQPRSWRETPCTRSGASRVRPASLSARDAVAVQKTGVHLREHRSDLHVMWSFQRSALARARAPRSHPRLHACRARSHPLPALMRSARRRPWRREQRTAAPARERSRQRPEPRGRCARPHQDGFHRRSKALQSHRPSRHNRRSCAQG